MNPIDTSIFELLKIGPGPSSSHTIGPMNAGHDFAMLARTLDHNELARAVELEARLFGSLSATGQGHGTDRAVIAGLMGNNPEDCRPGILDRLREHPDEKQQVRLGGKVFTMAVSDVVFDHIVTEHPFANTLVISLLDKQGQAVLSREYYSVGGGFIQWKGWEPVERGQPVYPFETMDQLLSIEDHTGLPLHEILIANEMAITGASEKSIWRGVDRILEAMDTSVKSGLKEYGVLPGTLGVRKKAMRIMENAHTLGRGQGRLLAMLNAYAFAASEENADGHRIVTAPTCGAAGVLPSMVECLKEVLRIGPIHMREGLVVAAGIGFLCKHNASISGADVGCQGEVGTATAMAAALMAYAKGAPGSVTSHAAEVGLEHQLGLTCDPVDGYVQIPCIERNAMGAVKAYNAGLIAMAERSATHMVTLDAAIQAMADIGREMSAKFKETSQGGLALSMVNC